MFKIPETACFQQAGWNGHGKLAVFFSPSQWPENLSHLWSSPETTCFQQAGWNGHGKLAVFFSHSEWPENLSHLWSSPKKCLNFAPMHCNVGGKEDSHCTNQPLIICSVHKISSKQKEDIFLATAMAMAVSATPVGVCLHKWEQSFFKLLLIVFYPDLCIKNERWYFNSNVMQMLIVEMNDKAIV